MIARDRIQFPFSFDVFKLQADVTDLIEVEWINHFVTQNYQGNWSVIPLTARQGVTNPILMAAAIPGDSDFVPTPFLDSCPYIQHVLETFKTDKLSVRLMKLTSGSEIKE